MKNEFLCLIVSMEANHSTTVRRAETKAAFAERWSISLRHLSNLIDAGVVPVVRMGRKCVRVPVKEADAALLKYQTGGKA